MRIPSRVRLTVLSVAVASAALLGASPAGASHVAPQCDEIGVDTSSGEGRVLVRVCVAADTGLYEPVYVECSTIYGCWARVTVGHHGSADVHGTVCFERTGIQPLCVALGTGQIPLVAVPPVWVCFNDSPWGPSCDPREVDEP